MTWALMALLVAQAEAEIAPVVEEPAVAEELAATPESDSTAEPASDSGSSLSGPSASSASSAVTSESESESESVSESVSESESESESESKSVSASEAELHALPWSIGTAHTLPEGRLEIGVFQPLRYGFGDGLELSTHPLLDVLMPNLALKKAWLRFGAWQLATRHGLSYPTGLLQLISRDGIGGILPQETRVPHIVQLTNEILLSRVPFADHVLTAKAGVTLAATFGQNTLQSIDLPVVYPRMAAIFAPASFVLGADLDGELPGPFAYNVDVDLFLVIDSDAPFALEHAGLATWRATEEFVVQAGYKLVFGSYPGGPDGFRTQWHILPLVDCVWAF